MDSGFQEALGHGDGFGLSDGGLGGGDEVSPRVDAVDLRGFAEAVEDLGDVNTPFGTGAVVILPFLEPDREVNAPPRYCRGARSLRGPFSPG